MSPRERGAIQGQLALVRGAIPKCVLKRYDALKRVEPALGECPAALAMATLVSVYRHLPARRRRALGSFLDLAGYAGRHAPARMQTL